NAIPSAGETSLVAGSALLTVLAFPDFKLWFLAWISLAPLLVVVARTRSTSRALVAGWLWGVVFFYGTCWWLTYPMIHFAGISAWLAYPLFLLPVMLVALFPALFAGLLARVVHRFGDFALLLAPLIWVSMELLRYAATGQLWNALGYSQAFHPWLIQTARWGGVYATSFTLVLASSGIAMLIVRRDRRALLCSTSAILIVTFIVGISAAFSDALRFPDSANLLLQAVAVQPNVPMDGSESTSEMSALLQKHLDLSMQGLCEVPDDVGKLVLVIWPESPMNFTYSSDPKLREVIGAFTHTYSRRLPVYVLLNSLEPAQRGGSQNSAILVNEKGEMSARYDKIRLMPFGEYVPLPQWLPGASSVRGLVGEFKPGSSYTLMPLGALRAGVFICIEAAHPGIAREFTNRGADVLINISNDGYLGPTPVMRQHLSNAIFRAVENDRPLVRVTNTGITALIEPDGSVRDQTQGFQEAVRSWVIATPETSHSTFYSRHGDALAYGCALISLGFISVSFMRRRMGTHASGVLSQKH
ncbi:MAG TPA: apolipoprotein N-acyltransferase, partial [Pyrinomonadaceae bacterium]|nr:apolipoprotein N-acyltransferase [Pyrinomonadaceae bacterium]